MSIQNSFLFFVLILFLPSSSIACAVCGVGVEQSNTSYLIMTGVLSFMPLLLVGGAVFWFFRYKKKQ